MKHNRQNLMHAIQQKRNKQSKIKTITIRNRITTYSLLIAMALSTNRCIIAEEMRTKNAKKKTSRSRK